jgi:uncharacterized protein YbaR (Trm112 family)
MLSRAAVFGASGTEMADLDPELLAMLVCPVPECRGALAVRAARLVCERCGLQYRWEEQWPVLIPEEAVPPQEL